MHFCEHFAQLKVLLLHRTHAHSLSHTHTHTHSLSPLAYCRHFISVVAVADGSDASSTAPFVMCPLRQQRRRQQRRLFLFALCCRCALSPRAVNAATAPFASFIKQLLSYRYLFLFHFLLLCVVQLACCFYPSAAAVAAVRNLCCKLFAVASACFFVLLLLLLRHIPLAPNKSTARCLLPLPLSLTSPRCLRLAGCVQFSSFFALFACSALNVYVCVCLACLSHYVCVV